MSSRVNFAFKVYAISLIPLGILVLIYAEPSTYWWTLLYVFIYATLWVGVPAYFARLFYELIVALRKRRKS